jgi:uncharacterized repeat protein (TIGR03837 family)
MASASGGDYRRRDATMRPVRWDVFCRVIDNLGDAGVCWRLSADLAARGERVRLILDDVQPLQRIAPHGVEGVAVQAWSDAQSFDGEADVVIEAFGCDPPPPYVAGMARPARPPVWINLEYLSAEPYAARSHGLASPQWSGPGSGLTKWFFYPGFGADTGGLLREPPLLAARAGFDRDAWLRSIGCERHVDERVAVLFSYRHPAIAAWLAALAVQPTLLLVPQGPAQAAVREALGEPLQQPMLRAVLLDWMPQPQFDRLLWSADLSVVRGEDSLVRALWAGAPFVWQLYPQHDGAHHRKLQAFLERWQAAAGALPAGVGAVFAWWNTDSSAAGTAPALPALEPWGDAVRAWREQLARQADLSTRLLGFVAARR